MAKSVFLHYESNHPKSLLQSLPHSQSLRVKKICSDAKKCEKEIQVLFEKFMSRGYPLNSLIKFKQKVDTLSRHDILKPKTLLVINHLKQNNPNILDKFTHVNAKREISMHEKTFLVMDFYRNMYGFEKLCIDFIKNEARRDQNIQYQEIVNKLNFIMSCRKISQLEKYCRQGK